jgi:hypothetical protein
MMEHTQIENEEHNVLFVIPYTCFKDCEQNIALIRHAFFKMFCKKDFDFAHYIYIRIDSPPKMLSDFDFAGIYDSDIVVMVRNAKGAKHYPAIRKIARRYKKEILEVDL